MVFANTEKTTRKIMAAFAALAGAALLALGSTAEWAVAAAEQDLAVSLELYKNNIAETEPFAVANMFPGDNEIKNFAVKVTHMEPVTLAFTVKEKESTGNARLASELCVKVADLETGGVIYEGSMDDIIGKTAITVLPANTQNMTEAYYQVSVSLPTRTGNEFQRTGFKGDFIWAITEDSIKNLNPPTSGPNAKTGVLYAYTFCFFILTFALLILLLAAKKRKQGEA